MTWEIFLRFSILPLNGPLDVIAIDFAICTDRTKPPRRPSISATLSSLAYRPTLGIAGGSDLYLNFSNLCILFAKQRSGLNTSQSLGSKMRERALTWICKGKSFRYCLRPKAFVGGWANTRGFRGKSKARQSRELNSRTELQNWLNIVIELALDWVSLSRQPLLLVDESESLHVKPIIFLSYGMLAFHGDLHFRSLHPSKTKFWAYVFVIGLEHEFISTYT